MVQICPHDEILRVQFQCVTQLLLETEVPIATIAERAGFRHAEYMTVAFKDRFKTTPPPTAKRAIAKAFVPRQEPFLDRDGPSVT